MPIKRKLPSKKHFSKRVLVSFSLAFALLVISLLIGILGYMYFFDLNWVDGLLNAAMILTGMGPVNQATNNGGKIFAAIYAIYSGVAFLTSVAVLFAPILHRFLHKFHLDTEDK